MKNNSRNKFGKNIKTKSSSKSKKGLEHGDFEARKKDHIRFALDSRSQNLTDAGFSRIRLLHNPLPELAFSKVNLQCEVLGKRASVPLFISSMTAGHEKAKLINTRLAVAAEERGWIMCVGSQRRELLDSRAAQEWKVIRKSAPNVRLISNIGIEELIRHPIQNILKIVENADAEAIIVHLNSIQEVIQKKFQVDCDLRGGLKTIEALVKSSGVPVIVKEVGFGFDLKTIQRLSEIGVAVVDLSGRGGSHWGMIEALRSEKESSLLATAEAFADWGYSNLDMLLAIEHSKDKKKTLGDLEIWASGGIRNGVHALKCLALGVRGVGVAQPLMRAGLQGEQALLNAMIDFENQVKLGMFAMGVIDLKQLQSGKYWYE